jgi:hypothetical protein
LDVNWLEIAKLVVAGLAGGAIVPYLTNLRERRIARAAVGERIADVEASRWAGDSSSYRNLRTVIHGFDARAMVAGMPRELVRIYIKLCMVAFATSRHNLEIMVDDEGGGISTRLDNLVTAARDLLIEFCWHPLRTRIKLKGAMAALRADIERLKDSDKDILWHWWDHKV